MISVRFGVKSVWRRLSIVLNLCMGKRTLPHGLHKMNFNSVPTRYNCNIDPSTIIRQNVSMESEDTHKSRNKTNSMTMCLPTKTELHMPNLTRKIGLKRPRKQLRFCDQYTTYTEDRYSPLTPLEAKNQWYQKEELAVFKMEARNYALGINREQIESRGFEKYAGIGPHNEKVLARKCVMRAIRQGMKDKEVANIANLCSKKTVQNSFWLAFQDYCHAYGETSPEQATVVKKRRQLESAVQPSKRIRTY